MDAQLTKLLNRFKPYFEVQADGRICCLPNGHCFPPRFDVVNAFINGKRFPQLKKRFDAEQNLSQFEPDIVVSKNFPTMLYCTVTGQLLETSVEAVKRHMSGKKYLRNKEKIDAGTRQLQPEPDIEDVLGVKKSKKKKAEGGEGEDDMEEDVEGEGEGESEEEEEEEEEEDAPKKKRIKLDKGDEDAMEEDEAAEGAEEDEDEEELGIEAVGSEDDFEFGDEPSSSGGDEMEGEDEDNEDDAEAVYKAAAAAAAAAAAKAGKKGGKTAPPAKGKQQGQGQQGASKQSKTGQQPAPKQQPTAGKLQAGSGKAGKGQPGKAGNGQTPAPKQAGKAQGKQNKGRR